MSLEVSHISKRFGEHVAVADLSFTLANPGVFALLGSNGAGKTTAIRVILGMLSKDDGTVLWRGAPLKVTHERVGYLAEERGLYPKYTIIEQMKYFAKLKGMNRDAAAQAIDYWFARLEIDEYRKKRADQLSKGNQQKIQLAAALISDPELIILDEPLSGLDPVNADMFKSVIRDEISKQKFLIMSSHQMAIVEEFCENIVIMHRGNVALSGNLNYIKRGYGRVNLSVKAESVSGSADAGEKTARIAAECGLSLLQDTPAGQEYHVAKEQNAHDFLRKAIADELNIVKFELREPSLHEIFVETVGGAMEKEVSA